MLPAERSNCTTVAAADKTENYRRRGRFTGAKSLVKQLDLAPEKHQGDEDFYISLDPCQNSIGPHSGLQWLRDRDLRLGAEPARQGPK